MFDLIIAYFIFNLLNKKQTILLNNPETTLYNDVYGIWEDNNIKEIYCIGDIHGDFFCLKQALELTDCIKFDECKLEDFIIDEYNLKDGCDVYTLDKINWNPEKINSIIIITGDVIDRCRNINVDTCLYSVNDEDCDYKILKLLFALDDKARQYNSRLILILGNHEIMNIQNDLRYVSNKGLLNTNRVKKIHELLETNINKVYGLIRVNNFIACHGGINSRFFKQFSQNEELISVFNKIVREFIIDNKHEEIIKNYSNPFWDRTNGTGDYLDREIYNDIFINNILNINRNLNDLNIIVGHCPQNMQNLPQGINKADRIWRIDIAMSMGWLEYKSKKDVMQIINTPNFKLTDVFKRNKLSDVNKVQILKIANNKEEIITGILSFDYFYNSIFKNDNQNKLKYFLYQIKKHFM